MALDPHIQWRIDRRRRGHTRELLRETRTELPQETLDRIAALEATVADLLEHLRMVAARVIEVETFAHNHRHWAKGSKLPMLFGRVENGRLVAIDADDGQPREEAA